MTDLPINKEEIEQERIPNELFEWCCQKIEAIAAIKEGKTAIRLGLGLCKQLVEEIYPLSIWATNSEHVAASAVIKPCIGSQRYDAIVEDAHHDPMRYFVEVTQAHIGQTEHFRMLHLENKGWAPGPLSEMKQTGSRSSRTIEPGRVLGTMTGQINKTIELVKEAISRKLRKDYERPIDLVVAFEDFIVKGDEGADNAIRRAANDALSSHPSPFSNVFIVGMSGNLILQVTFGS
jgi:hypothetical protein